MSTLAGNDHYPRTGYCLTALRKLRHLKTYSKARIMVAMSHGIPQGIKKYDWNDFYQGVSEDITVDISTSKMNGVYRTDCDHAPFHERRRLVTKVHILVNSSPIHWFCEVQNTMETPPMDLSCWLQGFRWGILLR